MLIQGALVGQNTRLNDGARMALAHGWAALDTLMKEVVMQFKQELCTTPPTETKQVLVNHQCYVSAAAFYVEMVKRVQQEISEYTPNPIQLPDITEELLQ